MEVVARGGHSRGPVWWARRPVLFAAAGLLMAGAAAGILVATSGPSRAEIAAARAAAVARHQALLEAARNATQARLASALSITPPPGASGVAPDTPVVVGTSFGRILSVQVTSGSGTLPGSFDPSGNRWVSTAALQPATTYMVTVIAGGPGGVSAEQTAAFSTLTPSALVRLTLFPYGGMTVGVGQPLVVHFSLPITSPASQQSVLSHFRVTESQPVPSGWHWFSPYELHLRPESYWPSGEKLAVVADLDGWDAGAGRWGTGRVTAHFVVGDSHVSVANLQTERMTVYLNGAAIASYPLSGGSPQWPTMGGTHVVMDKEPVVHMVSSTVGIPVNSPGGYDEYVYNDVHISDSGEYVHDAPWSVGAQGRDNVSHGCINLSPANSLAFYTFSQVGDIVQVVGSPRPPDLADHGVMDWSTPWSAWTPATVLVG